MKLAPGFASLLAISRLFTLASWVVIATLYFFTATLLKLPHRQRIPL